MHCVKLVQFGVLCRAPFSCVRIHSGLMQCFGSAGVAVDFGRYREFSFRTLCLFLSAVYRMLVDAGISVSVIWPEVYHSYFGESACLEVFTQICVSSIPYMYCTCSAFMCSWGMLGLSIGVYPSCPNANIRLISGLA